jgi:probable F420-dependent oxidoreductase
VAGAPAERLVAAVRHADFDSRATATASGIEALPGSREAPKIASVVGAMEIGVISWVFDQSPGICDLARAVEDTGLESLFLVEHTHVPASRQDLLDNASHRLDSHLLDQFTILGAAAAVTTTIKLGTSACVVVEHDPIILAKQVATIDYLSGGRFLFGVAAGWLIEEMMNHGVDPPRRWKLMREQVLAMKTIWTEDEAAFHGEFVDFDPIWLWPKPVQHPHPPVLLCGEGPRILDRVVDYGDGWLPIVSRDSPLESWLSELDQLCAAAGRERLPVTAALRDIDEALMEQCANLGVARCIVVSPIGGDMDVVQPFLQRCAAVATRLGT